MRKILLGLLPLVFLVPSAFAVPNLQLFIPGATYDPTTETWVTGSNDFDLWVEAGNLDKGQIFNIFLTAALAPGVSPVDGALEITNLQTNVAKTFNVGDYFFGTPPPGNSQLPPHGIFPTNYTQLLVTNETSAPFVDVFDNVDGGGPTPGNIFQFHVHTTYDFVHFDAYGYIQDPTGKFIFAPFSHDAQKSGPPIPEPATMLLFGVGLAGAGLVKRLRG